MEVTVLLFASLAERAGWRKRLVQVEEGDTVAAVRERVIAEYPQLRAAVPTLLYALDEEYAREDDPVRPGATLALIPPVSGGALC
ncbi:MAG TPA: molybdopterin converting factor subunit 1 [Tepidiformaceae bacterium]|nr:molybdopterin converting factor subunit 1 [Tepidiformaceae bacterium]